MASIVTDVGVVLASIHDQFKRSDPEAAELFQILVKSLVTDPRSPLWAEQTGLQGILISIPKNKEET